MKNNLNELLERLNAAESQPDRIVDSEFAKLCQEISESISKGHQARFNRLTFFALDIEDDLSDDIPF